MKKDSYEKLDDWFINLYEEWLFVRCFEYSAILLGEILGYKVFPNIDKKTGFIFLELAFPKVKLQEILREIEIRWYFVRLTEKTWELNMTIWNIKFERNKEKLIEIKKTLIKF